MKIVNFVTHSKLESALGYKKDYITVRILPEDFERFRTSFPGSGMNSRDNAVLMFSLNRDLVDYKYNGKSQTLPKRVKEGAFVGLIDKAREWAFQTHFVQGLKRTTGLASNPPFYAHNLYEKKTHGLTLKQMRRLYAMVSRGNQKAITYARNVLGIPFSESPSQVKAVVLHHVRDLAERKLGKMSFKKNEEYAEGWLKRRLRGNPFRSGGYLRETPKEAGYKVISLKGRQLILEDLADGKRELWARSPNFAGYAIFYKNNTYEFVTSVLPGMTPVLPRAGQPILGNPLSYHVGGLSSLGARGEERRRMRLGKMEYSALEFARKYPGWHGFNPKNPTGKVIKSLAKKGLVEISNISNQFKII